jgi:hypothetical protein
VIFLSPGKSYKFVLSPSTDTDPPTSPIWTQDNISTVPPSTVDLDVIGTAGEDLAINDAVYLSAGDGSRVAGRWYKTDADNNYSSSTATHVGMMPAALSSGASGSIRLQGRLTGLTSLTAGTPYYASATAGALTATAPTNARTIGVADSTTTLLLQDGQLTPIAQPISGTKTFVSPPIGVPTFARCTSTLTRNNSATLTDVTGMSFAVGASEVWAFEMHIAAISPTAADIKFTLTGPASPTAIRFGVVGASGVPSAASDVLAFASAVVAQTSSFDERFILSGLLRNGVNAGTVQLQMGQLAATVGDTKVYIESHLTAWRIS